MMSETDYQLIRACRQGDIYAWDRLLDKYERLVYSIALNYGLAMDDAADITQTTFTILIQSLENLRDDSHLASWLATVTKRHIWRWLERRSREQVSPEEDAAQSELIGNGGANLVERWERVDWLRDGLNMLDKRCRDLLLSLYFDPEQPSYAQVAERFDLPVGSIGPTRARCLERLKAYLTKTTQPWYQP